MITIKKTKRVSKEDIEECDNEKDLDSQVNIACKETFETYRSNDVEELDCRSVVVETDQKSIYEDRNQAKEAYDILGLSSDNRSVFESNSSVQSRRSDRIGVLEPVSRAGDDVQLAVSFGSVRSDSLGRSCDEICDADRKCESIQEKIQTFEKDSINENSQTTDQLSRTDIEHINNADIIVRGQAYDLYNRNDNGEYETVNPTSDSRKDADCLSMQNFLIESDETSLEDQHAISEQLAKDGIINRSVFSGSKSIHNIITVRDKVESIDEYKFVFSQLADYIEQNYNVKVDRNCCNPARLTRRPNAKRADKNCVQKLLYISDNIFDFKFKLDFKKYQQDQLQKEALHFLSVEQAEDVFANNPVAKQKALVTNRKNVDLFLDGLEHCVDGQHHTYVVDRIKSVIPQMRSLVRAGLFCWNEVLMILKRHGVKDRFEHYRKIVYGL